MSLNFDSIMSSANSVLNSGKSMLGSVSAVTNAVKIGSSASLLSAARSASLPKNGETAIVSSSKSASFNQNQDRDWRVRLSLPPDYGSSPVMSPLTATNGFVFPFTPQITIQHSANYQSMAPVHNNYPFLSYENSKVEQIVISGDFYCETAEDVRYWTAAVQYFRSATKMSYGETANTGAPPPVVKLNGYGDFVFNNVPVVILQHSIDLPKDVDYISAGINGATTSSQAVIWAPVKSTFTVTTAPLYSREQVRSFSLDSFIKGEYVFNGKGYI